jgi:ureidoacrylate peracid hydrolase
VIHVGHVLEPDAANAGILAEIVPTVRSAGFLNRGSVTAALHPGLVVEPGDILLEKPRFGAFHGTDLEQMLRARGIDTVIICGIATNVCCDTTAREANSRDFRVLFLSDGTATSTAEAHEATLRTIGAVFGQVLTVGEVLRKIQSGAVVAVPA